MSPCRVDRLDELGPAGLAAVVAASGVGVTVVDDDDRYVFANAEAERVLGRTADDLCRGSFWDVVAERDHDAIRGRVARGGPESPAAIAVVRPDGTEREVFYLLARVEVQGRAHRCIVFWDVTDARQGERAAAAAGEDDADGRDDDAGLTIDPGEEVSGG